MSKKELKELKELKEDMESLQIHVLELTRLGFRALSDDVAVDTDYGLLEEISDDYVAYDMTEEE